MVEMNGPVHGVTNSQEGTADF